MAETVVRIKAIDAASPVLKSISRAFKITGKTIGGLTGLIFKTLTLPFRTLFAVMGKVKRSVFSLKGAIIGLATGVALKRLTSSFLDAGKEFELMLIRLEGLTGSRENALVGGQFLRDFASKNAIFDIKTLQKAFVQFKAAGLDPMDGSLQSLVDAIAQFGGTSADLGKAQLAITQIANKGTVNMEELRQQLGERVPGAVKILARELGLTLPQLFKQIELGAISSAKALPALFRGFSTTFAGAADRAANTLSGLFAKLGVEFKQIQIDILGVGRESSIFEDLKTGLTSFVDLLRSNRDVIINLFQSMFQVTKAVFDELFNFSKQFADVKTFRDLINKVARGFVNMAAAVRVAGKAIEVLSKDIVGTLGVAFSDVFSGLEDGLNKVIAKLDPRVGVNRLGAVAGEQLRVAFSAKLADVSGDLQNVFKGVSASGFRDALDAPIDNIETLVRSLASVNRGFADAIGLSEQFAGAEKIREDERFRGTRGGKLFGGDADLLKLQTRAVKALQQTQIDFGRSFAPGSQMVAETLNSILGTLKEAQSVADRPFLSKAATESLAPIKEIAVGLKDLVGGFTDLTPERKGQVESNLDDLVAAYEMAQKKIQAALDKSQKAVADSAKVAAAKQAAVAGGVLGTVQETKVGLQGFFNGFREQSGKVSSDFSSKFGTAFGKGTKSAETFFSATANAFDTFFVSAIEGRLISFKDFLLGFLKDIAKAISQVLSQQLATNILASVAGRFGAQSAGPKGPGTLGLSPLADPTADPFPTGGVADTVPFAPRSKAGGSGGFSVNIENNTGTPAEGTATFTRDPLGNQVLNIVLDGIQRNRQGLRSTIAAI